MEDVPSEETADVDENNNPSCFWKKASDWFEALKCFKLIPLRISEITFGALKESVKDPRRTTPFQFREKEVQPREYSEENISERGNDIVVTEKKRNVEVVFRNIALPPPMFHCPGKQGEFRGVKCDPETKKDADMWLIEVEVESTTKNFNRRKKSLELRDRLLATDPRLTMDELNDCRFQLITIRKVSQFNTKINIHESQLLGKFHQSLSLSENGQKLLLKQKTKFKAISNSNQESNEDFSSKSVEETIIDYICNIYKAFMSVSSNSQQVNWKVTTRSFFEDFRKNAEAEFHEQKVVSTAFYAINFMSLAELERMLKLVENWNENLEKIVNVSQFLLNNLHYCYSLVKTEKPMEFYDEKREILAEFLERFKAQRKDCGQITPTSKEEITTNLSCHTQANERHSQNHHLLSRCLVISDDVEDGLIYNRDRDPPGQRSVYIPPGDPCNEGYRLSTFIKFPDHIPVQPQRLARFGFLWTGYKDRVKCFCCGLNVESWTFADDVGSPNWHRQDCDFSNGNECGNVPIGYRDALSDFIHHDRNNVASNRSSAVATITNPRARNHAPSQAARQSVPQNRNTSIEFATIASAFHEHLIRNLDLRKESERLRSYEHWPTDRVTVSKSDLAKSGFFYLGNLDRVQCFSCGGVLRNWNYGDNVDSEHRRHFPHCQMAQNNESRNIPIPSHEREAVAVFNEPPDIEGEERRNLIAMFPCQYPVNPHMKREEMRLETFQHGWPNQINATPIQVARAGFFYLGDRDRVKCWYCNGGLQNWDPDDEPWTEHAKWFPTCEFLLQSKGPEFVHRMVSLFPNLPRPVLRGPFDVPPPRGNAIQIGSTSHRAPTPPPQIIDPQAELRRAREELNKEMSSQYVKVAEEMGFPLRDIKRNVKRRIRRAAMYTSSQDLIDDLINDDGQAEDSDDEEMETQPNETSHGDMTSSLYSTELDEQSPSLAQRIQELREERKCKICLDKLADIVLVPCGHLCSCMTCTEALRKCPMCRTKIEKAIRTYMG